MIGTTNGGRSPITKAKTKAAFDWVKEMNKANKKKWEYLLIPHVQITSSVNTFKKLINQAANLDDYFKD